MSQALVRGKCGLTVETSQGSLDVTSRLYKPDVFARFALEITQALTVTESACARTFNFSAGHRKHALALTVWLLAMPSTLYIVSGNILHPLYEVPYLLSVLF